MNRPAVLVPYDEKQAQEVARIVGPTSAVALALSELERRRAAGEDVYLWWVASSVVVGPIPTTSVEVEG
jgi:hypothetical protein